MCCVVVRACVRVRVCAYTWVYVCAFVIARELSCYRVHAMCVRERAGVRACMRVTYYACECVYNRAWVGECTYMRMCLFCAHGHVVCSAMRSKGYIVMCSDIFTHTPISNTHPQAVFFLSKCTMYLICFKVRHTQC